MFLQDKQSWRRNAQRWDAGWLAACHNLASCFCLVRDVRLNIVQLMRPLPKTRLGFPSALRSRARTMGLFLESSGSEAQLCRKQHFWVLEKIFFAVDDWHAAIRWLILGGPWKACSRPHKIGQSPIRRFLNNLAACWCSCLVKTGPRLAVVLIKPLQKVGFKAYKFIVP